VSTAVASKRERTKQANRDAILIAAREVFAELGYGAASVRDIIRRTDLAAGTFYNYFPDKESVFRALIDESALRARAVVRDARARARNLEQFVHGGYRAYFQSIVDDIALFNLMRRNAGTIRTLTLDPALGPGVIDLAEDLEAAIARGDLPPFDVDFMAGAMAGVAFEVGMRMVDRDPIDVDAAADFATAIFLGGIDRLRG
jgi:AcrR family transcriptional regulator